MKTPVSLHVLSFIYLQDILLLGNISFLALGSLIVRDHNECVFVLLLLGALCFHFCLPETTCYLIDDR